MIISPNCVVHSEMFDARNCRLIQSSEGNLIWVHYASSSTIHGTDSQSCSYDLPNLFQFRSYSLNVSKQMTSTSHIQMHYSRVWQKPCSSQTASKTNSDRWNDKTILGKKQKQEPCLT